MTVIQNFHSVLGSISSEWYSFNIINSASHNPVADALWIECHHRPISSSLFNTFSPSVISSASFWLIPCFSSFVCQYSSQHLLNPYCRFPSITFSKLAWCMAINVCPLLPFCWTSEKFCLIKSSGVKWSQVKWQNPWQSICNQYSIILQV